MTKQVYTTANGKAVDMGALRLKAIMIQGKPAEAPMAKELKAHNKIIGKKITSTSVIKNALKHTGGRRIEAANLLGMGRNTITRKISELKIEDRSD